jgi:hypothetical protein
MEARITISATDATLGMGGWLSLTQSGLSPDKKRQAYSWRIRAGYLGEKAVFSLYADPVNFLPTSSSREISKASAMLRSVWIDGLGVTPFSTFK